MDWWKIALIALLGAGAFTAGAVIVVRATRKLRGSVETIASALNEAIAADKEPPKPRSLSSLESVLMERILRDFPDFNAKLFFQRVRRDAKTYYDSGRQGKVLFGPDASETFREAFADALPVEVGDEITVHRVSLSGYDGSTRRKMLTCQAAVGFRDTSEQQNERRLVLRYVAGYADDPSSEVVGFNCPNCGAALPAAGARVCVFCGTPFTAPVALGWTLFSAREG